MAVGSVTTGAVIGPAQSAKLAGAVMSFDVVVAVAIVRR